MHQSTSFVCLKPYDSTRHFWCILSNIVILRSGLEKKMSFPVTFLSFNSDLKWWYQFQKLIRSPWNCNKIFYFSKVPFNNLFAINPTDEFWYIIYLPFIISCWWILIIYLPFITFCWCILTIHLPFDYVLFLNLIIYLPFVYV